VVAGFVIDALGPGGAYLLSTTGNVGVIVALLALRYRGRSREARREPVLQSVRGGLRFARRNRAILWIIAVTFTTSALGMSLYQGLIAKWAAEVLGLRPGPYGVLASVWGVGTLTVSYSLAFRAEMRHKGKILVWGSVAFGLSFALFAFSRWLPLAGFAYLVNGAAWTGASIAATALVQSAVPDEVRGRVMSLFMINGAAAQLNGISLGALADWVGMEVLVPGTTLLCSALLIGMALTVPTLRHLDRPERLGS
jgi:predicted MFS family arabinose efflux permease